MEFAVAVCSFFILTGSPLNMRLRQFYSEINATVEKNCRIFQGTEIAGSIDSFASVYIYIYTSIPLWAILACSGVNFTFSFIYIHD